MKNEAASLMNNEKSMKIFAVAKINRNYSLFTIHYSFLISHTFRRPVGEFAPPCKVSDAETAAQCFALLRAPLVCACDNITALCTRGVRFAPPQGEFRLRRIFFALPLTSKLDALCGENANSCV